MKTKKIVLFASPLLLALSASLQAAILIYEPFDGATGNLPGSASGTGLTGNWAGSANLQVTTGSMSWGSLETSGNQTTNTVTQGRSATVGTGTTLSGGGHLDNGAVLWFSFLAESLATGRTYVTIGTGAPDGFDRIGANPGGFGLGVRLENGSVHAHGWDNNTAVKPAGTVVSAGTVFVVGRITWAAIGSNDILDIFLPGTDLVLPGTAASTLTRDFDQSTFTTLGIAGQGNTSSARVDEIRFGTSYASVTPIPEPGAALLGGLGVLMLLRRRR